MASEASENVIENNKNPAIRIIYDKSLSNGVKEKNLSLNITDKNSASSLSLKTKFCYGVGHVFNDLCASMWFTYLLIFFEKVLKFDQSEAGVMMLVGQLADGASTPVVGIFSDKENRIPLCSKYGRRKIWHLLGTVLVAVSFPFIFSPAYGLEDASDVSKLVYYCFFVIIFQFGWASVQISHLALIPDLTPKKSQRTELNAVRYAFTVLANLSVFTLTFFVLNTSSDSGNFVGNTTTTSESSSTVSAFTQYEETSNTTCSATDTFIDPDDLNRFRLVAVVCVIVGVVFSLIFHMGVKEPEFNSTKHEDELSKTLMRKTDWFKHVPFYLVALLYMATRLFVNLYQVYVPLFVQVTICMPKTAVAVVPFIMYAAGFFVSLIMKKFNKIVGRKGAFGSGCIIGLIGCIWVYIEGYPDKNDFVTWGIYVVAVFLGSGGSTLLVTSLSITADLIGKNTEGGAFVYGLMSLVDKVSNGVIIMIIQEAYTGSSSYYREIIFWASGGSCVIGLVGAIALIPVNVDRRGVSTSIATLVSGTRENEESSLGDTSSVEGKSSIGSTSTGVEISAGGGIAHRHGIHNGGFETGEK